MLKSNYSSRNKLCFSTQTERKKYGILLLFPDQETWNQRLTDLDDETVELYLEEILIPEMFVSDGEEDLELAGLECPAQDDVEPGPAVLQEVGDRPLVTLRPPAAVGHERDVSVRLTSLI